MIKKLILTTLMFIVLSSGALAAKREIPTAIINDVRADAFSNAIVTAALSEDMTLVDRKPNILTFETASTSFLSGTNESKERVVFNIVDIGDGVIVKVRTFNVHKWVNPFTMMEETTVRETTLKKKEHKAITKFLESLVDTIRNGTETAVEEDPYANWRY